MRTKSRLRQYAATLAVLGLCGAATADAKAPKPAAKKVDALRIVSVDVEGGTSLLFVTPEGKSLLIDTGWPPESPRAL